MHELRVNEIDRGSANRRAFDEIVGNEGVFGGAKRQNEAAADRCRGKRSEVEQGDHCEHPERADEKFVKVVAGDIFDDASAAFAEAAGSVDKFRADDEVASGAVRMTERGVDTRSDDAADGGFEIERNRKREELFLFVKRSGEVVEIGTGLHADGEIPGIVMRDLMEAGHVEGDVVARRRHADFELGAMATGDESELFEGGETNDLYDLFGGRWFGDGGRNDFVDGVLRAHCWIGNDLRSADGGFEARSEVRRVRHGARGRQGEGSGRPSKVES